MLQGILIIAIFLFFAVLMYLQKIPTFFALFLMSILIPLVAGAPLTGDDGILKIVNDGSYNLASSIPALLFGAWVGEIMNQTGITKSIIRTASELAGDKPLVVAIVMYLVVAGLFTSLTGLGAHIMVAMLVLPILTAVGIKPVAASCFLIMARTSGLIFNMSQWSLYMSATGLEVDPIRKFAQIVSITGVVVGILFIIFELKIKKTTAWAAPVAEEEPEEVSEKKVPILAYLTPIVPFIFVIGLKWQIIPALLVAALYGAITTSWKNLFPVLSKTIHEAFKSSAPALVLYLMIGMVLLSMKNAFVKKYLLELVGPILPSGQIGYILFFALLAPLCLYRGPLNLWGMGSGVIGLLVEAGTMPAMAIVAGFLAVQLIQLSSDPTNTHDVWTADYFGLEVGQLTKGMIVPMWIGTVIATIIASFIYF